MTNFLYEQLYPQGFDFETIPLKKAINMLKWIEIAKNIYEGVFEIPSKTPTEREDANYSDISRK